ncbi:porin [Stenotrophomonas riyadhensis]
MNTINRSVALSGEARACNSRLSSYCAIPRRGYIVEQVPFDFLDAARGGEGTAWTLGVNWYLNNWSRLMLNYVHWKTDNKVGNAQGPDSGNTVGVRAQVSF